MRSKIVTLRINSVRLGNYPIGKYKILKEFPQKRTIASLICHFCVEQWALLIKCNKNQMKKGNIIGFSPCFVEISALNLYSPFKRIIVYCFSFWFKQTLMGIFYYMHSVALIEDLPLEHAYADPKVFFAAADKAYSQVSSI